MFVTAENRRRKTSYLELMSNLEPPPIDIDWAAVKRYLTRPKLPTARIKGTPIRRLAAWCSLRRVVTVGVGAGVLSLLRLL